MYDDLETYENRDHDELFPIAFMFIQFVSLRAHDCLDKLEVEND